MAWLIGILAVVVAWCALITACHARTLRLLLDIAKMDEERLDSTRGVALGTLKRMQRLEERVCRMERTIRRWEERAQDV